METEQSTGAYEPHHTLSRKEDSSIVPGLSPYRISVGMVYGLKRGWSEF